METLILSVFITNKNLFIMNLLTITLPIVSIAIIIFVVMFVLNVKIWYYHIDVGVGEIFAYTIIISCLANIANHVKEIRIKNIFTKLILPFTFAAAGYTFAMIYLSNKFKVAESTEKYLIRLVYYPLIVDVSLQLSEYCFRTFDGGSSTTAHGRAHFIFFIQVAFGILGRYLTTISGSLIYVTVFSLFHFVKDILVHRLSWLQCYIAYKVKRFFSMKEAEEDFDQWFYSIEFQGFRTCVFNNDFVLELTGK